MKWNCAQLKRRPIGTWTIPTMSHPVLVGVSTPLDITFPVLKPDTTESVIPEESVFPEELGGITSERLLNN